MKSFLYYPGCTLKNKAKGLNETAKQCAQLLGAELAELEKWYCCQASFCTASDNVMNHLAAIRTLAHAGQDNRKIVTLCSTCFYVLKRVNSLMEADEEKRDVAFDFIEQEYKGPVEIIHFLELLKDEIGLDKVKEKTKTGLETLKVAPYYGCQLLRPAKELSLDDIYAPTIFESVLKAMSCQVVDYPFKTECCGSFLSGFSAEAVRDCVHRIVTYAKKNGADVLTTTCPLCNFNLEWGQQQIQQKDSAFKPLPVLYFTELMAIAFGIKVPEYIWQEHMIDPKPFLVEKGLVSCSVET